MGLLSTMRQRRQEKKAALKAAKIRAIAEAKSDAKLEKAKEKYLRKTAKQVRKADAKELKSRRKHEEKMAQSALEQLKAGNFSGANVTRYVGAARVAIPAVLPLAYRAMTQLQQAQEKNNVRRVGLTPVDTEDLAGDGAVQRARIRQLRKSVSKGGLPVGFAKDVDDRLDDLEKAVENTSTMNSGQTSNALKAVNRELDLLDDQIAIKRG